MRSHSKGWAALITAPRSASKVLVQSFFVLKIKLFKTNQLLGEENEEQNATGFCRNASQNQANLRSQSHPKPKSDWPVCDSSLRYTGFCDAFLREPVTIWETNSSCKFDGFSGIWPWPSPFQKLRRVSTKTLETPRLTFGRGQVQKQKHDGFLPFFVVVEMDHTLPEFEAEHPIEEHLAMFVADAARKRGAQLWFQPDPQARDIVQQNLLVFRELLQLLSQGSHF